MRLAETISIYAGGPGSGCNPEAGTCGRKSHGSFQSELKARYPKGLPLYHETPAKNLPSIKEKGLLGGEWEGVFATIGETSGFVSGPKVSIAFTVPPDQYRRVSPDMRYGGDEDEVFKQHPDLKGADVFVMLPGRVPDKWITSMTSMNDGKN